MTQKKVIFIPKQSISPKDKEKLTRSGHIVIECDCTDKIKTLTDIEAQNPNEILSAALKALGTAISISQAKEIFTETLYKLHDTRTTSK